MQFAGKVRTVETQLNPPGGGALGHLTRIVWLTATTWFQDGASLAVQAADADHVMVRGKGSKSSLGNGPQASYNCGGHAEQHQQALQQVGVGDGEEAIHQHIGDEDDGEYDDVPRQDRIPEPKEPLEADATHEGETDGTGDRSGAVPRCQ